MEGESRRGDASLLLWGIFPIALKPSEHVTLLRTTARALSWMPTTTLARAPLWEDAGPLVLYCRCGVPSAGHLEEGQPNNQIGFCILKRKCHCF